jgi:hypothetical protein
MSPQSRDARIWLTLGCQYGCEGAVPSTAHVDRKADDMPTVRGIPRQGPFYSKSRLGSLGWEELEVKILAAEQNEQVVNGSFSLT